MNYDRILNYIGEFGYYQKRACLLLCIIAIPVGIHGTSMVFQNNKPRFRCAVPGLPNDTYHTRDENHEQLVKANIPFDEETNQYSECTSFELTDDGLLPIQNKTIACGRWVYDLDNFGTSMATEFNFVCSREIYKAHINMMVMLGILVGSLFGGSMADYFGRKKVMIASLILQSVAGICLAFAWSIPVIIAIRFIMAFTGVAVFLGIFVLLAEVVGASRRTLATMSSMFGWCVGLFVLLTVQYFIRDWRTAQLVQTAPFFIYIIYWWIVEESPRWLLIRGRLREAEQIITYMAKVNKVDLPQEMEPVTSMSPLESGDAGQHNNKPKQLKVWHMCYRPALALRIIILTLCWSAINMVYYGLVLGVGDLIEGDIYINFTLQSAMELISNIVCAYLLEKIGRKKMFCTSIITAGLSCLSISTMIMVESDIRWLSAILFSVGKFGITLAFSLIYIVTAELLPTVVRNSGLGVCSFVGRIGGVLSPYIASMSLMISGPFGKALPVLLFGILSMVSGISALWLPETRNRKLPETIDEADNFKKLKQTEEHSSRLDPPLF